MIPVVDRTQLAAAGAPSVYLIQEPVSGLYVRFNCRPGTRITAGLTRRERASRFTRHHFAAECFARYLAGASLEIVRCDE